MMSVYFIRDPKYGVNLYRAPILSRCEAEAEIERTEGPGCRAPKTVVEFVEATGTTRASDDLLAACEELEHARSAVDVHDAMKSIRNAVRKAKGDVTWI